LIERKHKKLGSLISLSQIEDGLELKRVIKDFDKLDSNVKHQINIAFNKKFDDLSDKYVAIEKILDGDLDI